MIPVEHILLGVLMPALIVSTIALVPGVFALRWRSWAGAIALLVAFLFEYRAISNSVMRFPPVSAQDWVFWLAIPLAVFGAIDAAVRMPRVVRGVIGFLLFSAAALVVARFRREEWGEAAYWSFGAGMGAILAICWLAIDAALRSENRFAGLVGTIMILGVASLVMIFSGSQSFGQHAGSIAAGFCVLGLLYLMGLDPAVIRSTAFIGVGVVGLIAIVALEPLVSQLKPLNAALLALAPPLMWLGRLIPTPGLPPWARGGVQLTPPAAAVLAAAAISGIAFARAMSESSASPYGY